MAVTLGWQAEKRFIEIIVERKCGNSVIAATSLRSVAQEVSRVLLLLLLLALLVRLAGRGATGKDECRDMGKTKGKGGRRLGEPWDYKENRKE